MSVMKNGNPGSLAVVSQWSEESCGQEQGGLEEMGTLDMSLFSTLPHLMRTTQVSAASWRNSNTTHTQDQQMHHVYFSLERCE